MFTIEQELEFSLSRRELIHIRDEGEFIAADIKYGNYTEFYDVHFSKKTGVARGHEEADNPWRIRPKSATLPINHFYIFAGHRDWGKEDWVKLQNEHFVDDGAAAGARAKHHNGLATTAMSPFRFMVKKEVELSPIRDYAEWAKFRFESGEWQALPWADEDWFKNNVPAHHFAHIAPSDSCKVAFWHYESHAASDEVQTISPGRYLQAFFAHVLTPNEIRNWAVRVDKELELKLAWSTDEIYHVYRHGPHSCMAYDDSEKHWASEFNPTRIYAAGDLALAYLERNGAIIARALVWPEKMVAHRRYGDIERMDMALLAAGYELDSDTSNATSRGKGLFNGAKMLRVESEKYPGHFVMPYLDYGYRANVLDDRYFVMHRNGSINADSTNGLTGEIDEDDGICCHGCDDYFDEDDVWSFGDYSYCRSCWDSRFFSCIRCGDDDYQSNSYYVDGHGDHCDSCSSYVSTTCDYCHGRIHNDDRQSVHDARYEEGQSPEFYNDACSDCLRTSDDIVVDVNGVYVDINTVTTCGTCDTHFSGNLTEDECPTESCVAVRAEEEMETA